MEPAVALFLIAFVASGSVLALGASLAVYRFLRQRRPTAKRRRRAHIE